MDRGAWRATVQGVTKGSDVTESTVPQGSTLITYSHPWPRLLMPSQRELGL